MGDLLVFDVQGIPVEGKIVNLRQVKWNSFQPNFFILFQTGVLEDAPASFLGSVSGLDATSRISVQTRIIKEFPNVSVIDVTRIVGRVIEITDQMSLAIRMMAYLSILVAWWWFFPLHVTKCRDVIEKSTCSRYWVQGFPTSGA